MRAIRESELPDDFAEYLRSAGGRFRTHHLLTVHADHANSTQGAFETRREERAIHDRIGSATGHEQ